MANEKRLIEPEMLKDRFYEICEEYKCSAVFIDRIIDEIDDAPDVDAVEVVHGRWLYDSYNMEYFCSACHEEALERKRTNLDGVEYVEQCLTDYCPNCGAKMDGDGNG